MTVFVAVNFDVPTWLTEVNFAATQWPSFEWLMQSPMQNSQLKKQAGNGPSRRHN